MASAAVLERLPSGVFFVTPTDFPSHIFPVFPGARPVADPPGVDGRGVIRSVDLRDRLRHVPPLDPNLGFSDNTFDKYEYQKPSPSPANKPTVHCLPLLNAAIDVRVDSTVATTTFFQHFTNTSDMTINEAHYTFPVYDGAVVTSFRYYIGDSKVLVGRVLSNEEAMRVYIQAIEAMEAAALLDETTPEVFQTRMGNIPPKTSVKVEITYVNQVKADNSGKGILITIPTSVAPRYGSRPARFSESSALLQVGLSIIVRVTSGDAIRDVECRSHPASITMGTAGPLGDLKDFESFMAAAASMGAARESQSETYDPRQATIRLADPVAKMDKDFVVFVSDKTETQKPQKSRALLSPVNEHGQAALMVTANPSELFSTQKANMSFEGEIVFVADRSGSMAGEKISGLREALHVFLKSLPKTCSFNIWSFGSSHESLWPSSQPYSQKSLDEAVAHVQAFQADMGGTELLEAVKAVTERRSLAAGSTQIIVLTDGEVWDTDAVTRFIQSSRKTSGESIRLFALGIGGSVSHRLIEGMAGAGGGVGEVVNTGTPDKWQDRVIRMLKAALMPPSWKCEIDLGPQYMAKNLCIDKFESHMTGGDVAKATPWQYVQAPGSAMVHHYRQQTFFFLLNIGNAQPPTGLTVVGTATASAGNDVLRQHLAIKNISSASSAIHHLAAKAVLMDLDMRTVGQDPVAHSENLVATRNAIQLGKQYSITSKWTCFVATDQQDATTINPIDIYSAPVGHATVPQYSYTHSIPDRGPAPSASFSYSGYGMVGSSRRLRHGVVIAGSRSPTTTRYRASGHHSSFEARQKPRSRDTEDEDSENDDDRERRRRAARSYFAPPTGRGRPPRHSAAHTSATARSITVSDVVQSQDASGRFNITSDMRDALSSHIPQRTRESIQSRVGGGESSAVDTAMMTEYIRTEMPNHTNLLELVVDKAVNSLERGNRKPKANQVG